MNTDAKLSTQRRKDAKARPTRREVVACLRAEVRMIIDGHGVNGVVDKAEFPDAVHDIACLEEAIRLIVGTPKPR
jgi:hypothetical protein